MNYILLPDIIAQSIIIILMIYSNSSYKNLILKDRIFNNNMYVVFSASCINVIRILIHNFNNGDYNNLLLIINTLFYAIIPCIAVLYFFYSYVHIKDITSKFNKELIKKYSIPYILYLILLVINVKYKFIFSVDSYNLIIKEKFFWIYYLILFTYSLITILSIKPDERNIRTRSTRIINSFPLTIIGFMIAQKVFNEMPIEPIISTLAILTVYLYVQNKGLYIDSLTKLNNRKSFFNLLESNIKQEKDFTLIIISIDDFKYINDKFGQKFGDSFLISFSDFLNTLSSRKNIFRYNGDEFALVIEDEERVSSIVAEISETLKLKWKFNDIDLQMSVCISVIRVTKKNNNLKKVISLLEYSITKLKNKGKNGIVYCDETIELELERKKVIIELLKKEIKNKGFEVYYQPIFDVNKGKFSRAEALARIKDPNLGTISPLEFIPIAEERGLIFDIGYIILDKTCCFINRLKQENIEIDSISVNFSPLQFEKFDIVDRVEGIIMNNNVSPSKIAIEITESFMFEKSNEIIRKMNKLHAFGINFYLDDFGTGYSNISRVIQLPFNIIKFDKSIVDNCKINNESYVLLKSLTMAFLNANINVLVEGVETFEQKELVIEFSNFIQGFYYSKPLNEDSLIEFLKSK